MLSEKLKLIEKLVETAKEEIDEEIELIKEGSELKNSTDIISTIMLDLSNSIKEIDRIYESYLSETEIQEESIEDKEVDSTFQFELGQKVVMCDKEEHAYPQYKKTLAKLGCSTSDDFMKRNEIKEGITGIVIAQATNSQKKNYYAIALEDSDKKFCSFERGLKKI